MDGKTLLRDLRQFLQEQVASTWMDDKTSYDYLYKAAVEFVSRTKILSATQSITTVANQAAYCLKADFLEMLHKDAENLPYIKYNNGTTDVFVSWREYSSVVSENQTTPAYTPGSFSITSAPEQDRILGTSSGTLPSDLGGESILIDNEASFQSTVEPGDTIHNITSGACGVVTLVTAPTGLRSALFDGDRISWEENDEYYIYPQGKMQIVLDPAPSTSGHTITIYYVPRPTPVYSERRTYPIPIDYKQALIYYAAWMYKNRDREPNYAELELKYFEEQVKKACVQYGKALHRKGFRVNYRKTANEDSSWR